MAQIKLYRYDNQSDTWELIRTLEVNEDKILIEHAKCEIYNNQSKEYLFNRVDCTKDDGTVLQPVLTLNTHKFYDSN